MSYRGFNLYPRSVDLRINNLIEGQRGLFYDYKLGVLLIGFIKDECLHGKVIGHKSDNHSFQAFGLGYRYNDWDLFQINYVGKLSSHTNLTSYLETIDKMKFEEIRDFFITKEILIKNKYI